MQAEQTSTELRLRAHEPPLSRSPQRQSLKKPRGGRDICRPRTHPHATPTKTLGRAADESHELQLVEILRALQMDYQGRGVELVQVASGWRFQVPKPVAHALEPIYQEKPKRFSRVILGTWPSSPTASPSRGRRLALRGVAVSAEVLKSLIERQWVCSLGAKEIPGRPMQYGTTDEF